jgi:hypothetical protein
MPMQYADAKCRHIGISRWCKKDGFSCWDPAFLSRFCDLFPLITIKTVRVSLAATQPLIQVQFGNPPTTFPMCPGGGRGPGVAAGQGPARHHGQQVGGWPAAATTRDAGMQ